MEASDASAPKVRPLLQPGEHLPAPGGGSAWAAGDFATAKAPCWLLFYPLAYSPVCQEDLRQLDAAAERLGFPGSPCLAVSVDRQEHAERFFRDLGIERLRPLADPDGLLARGCGVLRVEGVAARASLLVDAEGTILQSVIHDLCFPRPVAMLLSWLPARST